MIGNWLDRINWDEHGLVPVITQDSRTGQVLMLAWMNREALMQTVQSGRAVYWSRSRQCLWRKGETSGNSQLINDIRLDCDHDAVLLRVEQTGGIACHTGRASCFFHQLKDNQWLAVEPVLKDPSLMYRR
ncbi:MAG: phosphoribosyl-AMP cyclohydrolase [Gammaproteobacteria bacterium]